MEYFLGEGPGGIEVAVANSAARPARTAVRRLWKLRHGGKPSPLLLVVLWPDASGLRASLSGPLSDEAPVYEDLESSILPLDDRGARGAVRPRPVLLSTTSGRRAVPDARSGSIIRPQPVTGRAGAASSAAPSCRSAGRWPRGGSRRCRS
jgi:hypothetical protein